MILTTLARSAKNWVLPGGPAYRRIPIGPLKGCTLSIDFHEQTLQYLGLYEYELRSEFERLVRPGYRCFDVGGGHGYYAVLLAKRTGAPVLSIDCDAAAVARTRAVVSRNPYPVMVVEAVVGAREDQDTRTLDGIAEQAFVPDFIKMDVEGAEVAVLRGARRILAERHPSLIIEVHGAEVESECLALLRAQGYDPHTVSQRHRLREHRPMAHNRWLVCEGWAPPYSVRVGGLVMAEQFDDAGPAAAHR